MLSVIIKNVWVWFGGWGDWVWLGCNPTIQTPEWSGDWSAKTACSAFSGSIIPGWRPQPPHHHCEPNFKHDLFPPVCLPLYLQTNKAHPHSMEKQFATLDPNPTKKSSGHHCRAREGSACGSVEDRRRDGVHGRGRAVAPGTAEPPAGLRGAGFIPGKVAPFPTPP